MKSFRTRFSQDWDQGSYDNSSTRIDATVSVSEYNHPAITPNLNITTTDESTGAQLYTAATGGAGQTGFTSPTLNSGGQWVSIDQFLLTNTSLDTFSFTTTAEQVQVQLIGYQQSGIGIQSNGGLFSNQLRNGCVVNIIVDGVLVAAVDTWQGSPLVTITLDGLSHVVELQHSGGVNSNFSPFSQVTNTVGTTVGQTSNLSALYHGTPIQSAWRILATATNQYSLYRTLPGGSETLIVSGLLTGQIYTGYIPGVNLMLQTNVPLNVNDQGTFTTDYSTCAIQFIALGFGTATGTGSYTFPVMDSLDDETQWVLADWIENVPLSSAVINVGHTPTPDASWESYTVTNPADVILPDGTEHGIAGFEQASRGRYAQITLNFPAVVVNATPYVRDFTAYCWNPNNDPNITNFAIAQYVNWGPVFCSFAGSLVTMVADLDDYIKDYIDSFAINTSVDQYLWAYASDFGLTITTAEPQNAIIVRILSALQSRGNGGSLSFIAQYLNWYVSGEKEAVDVSVVSGSYIATSGVVTVSQQPSQQYSILVGAAPYTGLEGIPVGTPTTPATARYMITQFVMQLLNPVGAIIAPNNTGLNINFN